MNLLQHTHVNEKRWHSSLDRFLTKQSAKFVGKTTTIEIPLNYFPEISFREPSFLMLFNTERECTIIFKKDSSLLSETSQEVFQKVINYSMHLFNLENQWHICKVLVLKREIFVKFLYSSNIFQTQKMYIIWR